MINLDSDTERLARSTEFCNNKGIVFERVSAVKGHDKLPLNGTPGEGWNHNASGLCQTTINIIEEAKSKGFKNILILEDDVYFTENFNSIVSYLSVVPKDWDFIHLNANHQMIPTYYSPYVNKIAAAICCQAYAINEHMYDMYLTELKKFERPIDEITRDFHKNRDNSYCPTVNIVFHVRNKYSTLREKIVNY